MCLRVTFICCRLETLELQENSNAESYSCLSCWLSASVLSEDMCCVGHFRSEAWFTFCQLQYPQLLCFVAVQHRGTWQVAALWQFCCRTCSPQVWWGSAEGSWNHSAKGIEMSRCPKPLPTWMGHEVESFLQQEGEQGREIILASFSQVAWTPAKLLSVAVE